MRDSNIDFYRGLAVVGVIVLHAWMTIPNIGIEFPNLHLIMSRFSVSMQLFFVLSGYLIYMSYNNSINKKHYIISFYIKRMSKIIPLYLIFLIINIIVFLGLNYLYYDFDAYSMFKLKMEHITKENILYHIFFLQCFSSYRIHSLLDGSWSIIIEMFFYIIFPFLVYDFVNTKKKSLYFFVISLFLMVLFPFLFGFIWEEIKTGSFYYYFFTNQFPCFVLGIIMFHYNKNFTNSKIRVPFIILALIMFIGMIKGSFKPIDYHIYYAIAFVFFIIGSYDVILSFRNHVLYKYISKLGIQSYSIFFLHLILMNVSVFFINIYLTEMPILVKFSINLILIFSTSITLSNLIFDPIDRYFCSVGKKIINKLNFNI